MSGGNHSDDEFYQSVVLDYLLLDPKPRAEEEGNGFFEVNSHAPA